ncbi:armadillo-type protein [Baffinella frigidus]|nr:armadillo-type protein [Cryptophyta sp. CCMP2293]
MDGSRGGSRAPAGGGGWQRLEATLKFLESSTSDRIDGLEGVRDALASCGSFPPPGLLRQRLLTAASTCATDPNSRVSLKWLQFLQETATANASDIDEELPGLIAACVEALGSSSSACRQTAVQVLCACGKAPDPGPQALLCGVTEGTRHATARVRAESCSAVLTVLDSAHFRTLGGDDQVIEEVVAPALLECLEDSTPTVVEAAEIAITSLRALHAQALATALEMVSPKVLRLYRQRFEGLEDEGKGRRGGGGGGGGGGGEEGALRHGGGGGGQGGEEARQAPSEDGDGDGGFVSGRLLAELQDQQNWRVRALAVEELQAMVRAVRGPEALKQHLVGLVALVVALVQDANFKIQITALQTLGPHARKTLAFSKTPACSGVSHSARPET